MLTPGHAADAVTTARQTTAIATKLLFTHNPETSVAGKVGVRKRAIWAPPIPLAKISDAGHRTGTTINDVLVAALAGALTTYLREHGNEPVDVPTMVPVNVRPLDQPLPRELGNQFALVLLSLPSGLPTPFARLAETKRRMDTIKHSPEAFLTFEMIRGIGRTGPDLERYLVNFFANKASGVTTNVPGPTATRYVAGSRITAMLGWAPESGQQTLGTCIFTYDGNVHVGFKVDTAIIEHPEQLQEAFLREVDELCRLSPARRTSEPLTRRAV
jgi:WS/DGAT/MGAT family acyltransferase